MNVDPLIARLETMSREGAELEEVLEAAVAGLTGRTPRLRARSAGPHDRRVRPRRRPRPPARPAGPASRRRIGRGRDVSGGSPRGVDLGMPAGGDLPDPGRRGRPPRLARTRRRDAGGT